MYNCIHFFSLFFFLKIFFSFRYENLPRFAVDLNFELRSELKRKEHIRNIGIWCAARSHRIVMWYFVRLIFWSVFCHMGNVICSKKKKKLEIESVSQRQKLTKTNEKRNDLSIVLLGASTFKEKNQRTKETKRKHRIWHFARVLVVGVHPIKAENVRKASMYDFLCENIFILFYRTL